MLFSTPKFENIFPQSIKSFFSLSLSLCVSLSHFVLISRFTHFHTPLPPSNHLFSTISYSFFSVKISVFRVKFLEILSLSCGSFPPSILSLSSDFLLHLLIGSAPLCPRLVILVLVVDPTPSSILFSHPLEYIHIC